MIPTTTERLASLKEEWHQATGHLSIVVKIMAHPAYRAILEYGWDALRFILADIEQGGVDYWHVALWEITGEEPEIPPEHQGDAEETGKAWLKLAKERGWYEPLSPHSFDSVFSSELPR